MQTNVGSIKRLHPTKKQIHGTKRRYNAYHAYLAYFFADFAGIETEEKKQLMCAASIHDPREYEASEEDSVVSSPSIRARDIFQLAAYRWRCLSPRVKAAWKAKETHINNLPVLRRFISTPRIVTKDEVTFMLTQEYNRFVKMIHNTFKRRNLFKDSTVVKVFGKEKITIGSKVYRTFVLNRLLNLCFFGRKYSVLNKDKVIYRYSKTTIAHISSMKRMLGIFDKYGKSAFSLKTDDGCIVGCAGKVTLKEVASGKEGIGYIVDGRNILMESGARVNMRSIRLPTFVKKDGRWVVNGNDDVKYVVTHYDPIRIKICDSGNIHVAYNIVTLSLDRKKVICS